MPNYYNPNLFYPATYQNAYSNPIYPLPQQQVAQSGMAMTDDLVMKWVDGEVGAKAFQMPPGWPANKPIPLWDSTDTNVFLKSWSPMGFPNPIQKLHYTMPEQQAPSVLPAGQSGQTSEASAPDMSQYVTKDDLNQMKQEIRNMLNNQNGRGNQRNDGNRGENR